MLSTGSEEGGRAATQEAGARRAGGPGAPPFSLHGFCDDTGVADAIEKAARGGLGQAGLLVRTGGISAAEDFYVTRPTPDLLILQSDSAPEALLAALDSLATVCDPETKVLVIGSAGDAALYRELMRRGVAGYLAAPVGVDDIVSAISRMVPGHEATGPARAIAFIGARGGVGSSTLAQNVAFMMARLLPGEMVLADLDPDFGTAALNFDVPVDMRENADGLVPLGERLSLLSFPASPGRQPLSAGGMARRVEEARSHGRHLVLDMPHGWSGQARRLLADADGIVLTATPDLTSLRNVARLTEALAQLRPGAAVPHLILNQTGIPGRRDIPLSDFMDPPMLDIMTMLPFVPALFGAAQAGGRMIVQTDASHPVSRTIGHIARILAGRHAAAGLACGNATIA